MVNTEEFLRVFFEDFKMQFDDYLARIEQYPEEIQRVILEGSRERMLEMLDGLSV